MSYQVGTFVRNNLYTGKEVDTHKCYPQEYHRQWGKQPNGTLIRRLRFFTTTCQTIARLGSCNNWDYLGHNAINSGLSATTGLQDILISIGLLVSIMIVVLEGDAIGITNDSCKYIIRGNLLAEWRLVQVMWTETNELPQGEGVWYGNATMAWTPEIW
ncbi:hypothetical protein BU17DRAFT_65300 [Hysterangium stoloniferum]|nr:hypothetical protein BU17DRAFT_65300 [Hysterangium stoloniferum]